MIPTERHYSRRILLEHRQGLLGPNATRKISEHLVLCAKCSERAGIGYAAPRPPGWLHPSVYAELLDMDAVISPVHDPNPSPWKRTWEAAKQFMQDLLQLVPETAPARWTWACAVVLVAGLAGLAWQLQLQNQKTLRELQALRSGQGDDNPPYDPLAAELKEAGIAVPGRSGIPAQDLAAWAGPARTLLAGGKVPPREDLRARLADLQKADMERGLENKVGDVPYLVFPVATEVASNRPTFRWEPLRGAAAYLVKLTRPDGIVWHGAAGIANSLTIPPTEPELQPGQKYSWLVEATVGGQPKISDTGVFLVLTDSDQKAVAALATKFAGSPVLLAALFESYGLFSDASEQLEGLLRNNPNSKALVDALAAVHVQTPRKHQK